MTRTRTRTARRWPPAAGSRTAIGTVWQCQCHHDASARATSLGLPVAVPRALAVTGRRLGLRLPLAVRFKLSAPARSLSGNATGTASALALALCSFTASGSLGLSAGTVTGSLYHWQVTVPLTLAPRPGAGVMFNHIRVGG